MIPTIVIFKNLLVTHVFLCQISVYIFSTLGDCEIAGTEFTTFVKFFPPIFKKKFITDTYWILPVYLSIDREFKSTLLFRERCLTIFYFEYILMEIDTFNNNLFWLGLTLPRLLPDPSYFPHPPNFTLFASLSILDANASKW